MFKTHFEIVLIHHFNTAHHLNGGMHRLREKNQNHLLIFTWKQGEIVLGSCVDSPFQYSPPFKRWNAQAS
jgi:hypothetical protein